MLEPTIVRGSSFKYLRKFMYEMNRKKMRTVVGRVGIVQKKDRS